MKQTVHQINIKFNQNICQYIVKHKIKLRHNSLYKNLKQADSLLSTDINCWIQNKKRTVNSHLSIHLPVFCKKLKIT